MKIRSLLSTLGILSITTCLPFTAAAAEPLSVAPVFGDHMVLQRDLALPVWGAAQPGSTVKVSFGDQGHEAKADAQGHWRVVLDSMQASANPATMTVHNGSEKVSFEDVLVGEVWICSGQSNMHFKLSSCENAAAEIAAAKHPMLRLNGGQGWQLCSPQSATSFSGVAYFFGQKLQAETGVPVGLIARALGGTPVEWWTPSDKIERVPFAKAMLEKPAGDLEAYEKVVAEWQEKVKAEGRKEAGPKPKPTGTADDLVLAGIYAPGKVGALYRQHWQPIAGYGIRGATWYQGERNTKAGLENANAYRALLANMITSWREDWKQGDFPFLVVQLPTFSGGGESWPVVQEAQAAAVTDVPNAASIDIRDQPDGGLHPKNKKPVGERLADLALEKFVK